MMNGYHGPDPEKKGKKKARRDPRGRPQSTQRPRPTRDSRATRPYMGGKKLYEQKKMPYMKPEELLPPRQDATAVARPLESYPVMNNVIPRARLTPTMNAWPEDKPWPADYWDERGRELRGRHDDLVAEPAASLGAAEAKELMETLLLANPRSVWQDFSNRQSRPLGFWEEMANYRRANPIQNNYWDRRAEHLDRDYSNLAATGDTYGGRLKHMMTGATGAFFGDMIHTPSMPPDFLEQRDAHAEATPTYRPHPSEDRFRWSDIWNKTRLPSPNWFR